MLCIFYFTYFYGRSKNNNCRLCNQRKDDMHYTERILAAILLLLLVAGTSLAWVNIFLKSKLTTQNSDANVQ